MFGFLKKLFGGGDDYEEPSDEEKLAEFEQQKADGELDDQELFDKEPAAIWSGEGVNNLNVAAGLLFSYGSGSVHLFDFATGEKKDAWEFEDALCGALSPDGKYFALGSREQEVDLFDLKGEHVAESDKMSEYVEDLVWLSDEQLIAIDQETQVKVFSSPGMKTRTGMQLAGESTNSSGFAVDRAKGIAYVSFGTNLAARSIQTGEKVWDVEYDDSLCKLALSADGSRLATVNWEGKLIVFDASSGQEVASTETSEKQGIAYPGGSGTSWSQVPVYSPDGRLLAINSKVGKVQLRDAVSLDLVHEFERRPGAAWIEALAFGPGGELIAGSSDGKIGIWNATDFSQIRLIELD